MREAGEAALAGENAGTDDRARPLEFDDGGFPIPQPLPSVVRRLGRLLEDK